MPMTLSLSKLMRHAGAITVLGGFAACTTLEPSRFERADTNRDGQLDVKELETALTEGLFRSGDLNGDGIVTFTEWKTVLPTANKATFLKYAPDGNMTLAQASQAVDEDGIFDRLLGSIDIDANGIIDDEEARIFHSAMEAAEGSNDVQRLNQILTKAQNI